MRSAIFLSHGDWISIPLGASEPLEQWVERVAFILEYLERQPEADPRLVSRLAREHVNRLVLGVTYSTLYR